MENISYAKTVYGQEEIDAVVKCLNESTQMGNYSRKFESKIAQNNRELNSDIETLLINTLPKNSHISSSIVRDIIKNKGDVSKLIPNHEDYKLFFKK